MEYSREDKEFYELMRIKSLEIEALKISEEEKKRLYSQVEMTIQRYEENKNSLQSAREALKDINETYERTKENLGKIREFSKVLGQKLSSLEKSIMFLMISKAGRKQKIENN